MTTLCALIAMAVADPGSLAPGAFDVAFRAPSVSEDDPLDWEIVPLVVQPGGDAMLEVRLTVPDDYMVYRSRVALVVSDAVGLHWGELDLPPGVVLPPRREGEPPRVVFDDDVVLRVPVSASAEAPVGPAHLRVTLEHQGCHRGLCYPRVRRTRESTVRIVAPRG